MYSKPKLEKFGSFRGLTQYGCAPAYNDVQAGQGWITICEETTPTTS
jgi:hypothetical protein